jgi:multiple sugar transport system permease protein
VSTARFRGETAWAYAFIAPPFLGFLAFALGPMIASFVLSFTHYDVLSPPKAVGLENYRDLFTSDYFVGRTLVNTAFYMLGVPIGMAVALAIAMLLDRIVHFRGFFRTVYFVPSVCSIVALALLWKLIYRGDYGLLNTLLVSLGIHDPPSWLSDPRLVKPSLVFMGIRTNLGYTSVVFLAALQGVPRQHLEAAELDGANAWQRFRWVVFPAISPTTFFLSVTGTIAALQNFDQVYVMTRGGPAYASATYMLYVYVTGFQYFEMGYASAMAWLLAIVVLLVTWLQFKLAKRWVFDD